MLNRQVLEVWSVSQGQHASRPLKENNWAFPGDTTALNAFSQLLEEMLEMPPEEAPKATANIAINSALTGHLVFSTLHTNDAAGTFPRLIDLGANPTIIPSALRISMAQRLVRRLCSECKKEVVLDGQNQNEIETTINSIEDKSTIPTDRSKMWTPVGCEKCNHTGYKGRIGIYEAILMNKNIEAAVQRSSSDREIWDAAKGQGILTMKQDGALKVLAGITSLQELERVITLTD